MQSVRWFLSSLAIAAVPLAASAQSQCSHETLPVQGASVNFELCAAPGREAVVPITATVSGPGGSFTEQRSVRPMGGAGRVLENVDLARIGLHGVLHMTLVYSEGRVSIESALLTPGAVQIK